MTCPPSGGGAALSSRIRAALASYSGSGLAFHVRVRWKDRPASASTRPRCAGLTWTMPCSARWSARRGSDQRVNATPWLSGRAPATATTARRSASVIRRGRPPRYSGSSDAIPRSLKSWITRRTCDSSVIHIAAICGTEFPTPDANKIAARSRVAKCLAFLARLFNAVASASASGLTNTSGGRILTSTNRMHPNSPPAASFRSNLQRRATRTSCEAVERRDRIGEHPLGRPARVDDREAPGLGGGELVVGARDHGEEPLPRPLEPVGLPRADALAPHRGVEPQQQRAVGRQPARGERVEAADLLDAELAARALVGERGVDEAVEQHPLPPLEQRLELLGHELGARSGVQQRLRARVDVERRVLDEHADALGELGPAGLAEHEQLPPAFGQHPRQPGDQGGLPGAVEPLDGDEPSACDA